MATPVNAAYPFNLPSYHSVFDDGIICTLNLSDASTSWRSEEYPDNSKVLVLDHSDGLGTFHDYDDAGIDKLLAVCLLVLCLAFHEVLILAVQAPSQPKLRIMLLQPTAKELLAYKACQSEKTSKVLKDNGLIHPGQLAQALTSEPHTNNHLDISKDSLFKVLAHYRIAPSACAHIRGQEQIYGSRTTHDESGELEAFGTPMPIHFKLRHS